MGSKILEELEDIKVLLVGGEGGGLTNAELRAAALHVIVDNQLDLTIVTSHLLAIKNSVAAIDVNTDTIEQKLLDTITAINANGTVNHADLLTLLAQLQAINANTDTQEAVLNSILSKIIAAPATVALQTTGNASLAAIDAKLAATLNVNVVNQIDLTTVTSHLLAIKNSVAAIDVNTDTVEQKLLDTITAINANGTVNHADLLTLLAQLQAINVNTDTQEAVLNSILSKIIAAPATAALQTTGNASLAAIDAKLAATLNVNVVNQIDLTTVTSHLLAIKNSVAAIDVNTDTVEQKISDTITAINANGTVNHADLLTILTQLQAVNANTDTVEAVLNSILSKIIAAPATLSEQQTQTTALNTVNTNLGTDGAASPVIAGTGVRGWLRAIYDKTVTGLARAWTLSKNTDNITVFAAEKNTYVATYKLTTRPYALSWPFTANTRRQFATIFHTSSATKTVRIRRVEVLIKSCSGTSTILADIVRLTAGTLPANGNPAITPSKDVSTAPTAEATCLALPATEGVEGVAFGGTEFQLGNTGGAPTTNPPVTPTGMTLFSDTASEGQSLTMLAGVAEGFAVVLDNSAATTITAIVRIVFTEE